MLVHNWFITLSPCSWWKELAANTGTGFFSLSSVEERKRKMPCYCWQFFNNCALTCFFSIIHSCYCCISTEAKIFYSFKRNLRMQNKNCANIIETTMRQRPASFTCSNRPELHIFALSHAKANSTLNFYFGCYAECTASSQTMKQLLRASGKGQ